MNSTADAHTATRRRRVMALAAGVGVLGLGATVTLAAWTDTEWVFGGASGAGDDPGIGTSTFEIEQDTDNGLGWVQDETEPGNEMVFASALAMEPGDSVYSTVELRTVTDSVAGDVTLQAAISADVADVPGVNDGDGLLYDALQVRVATDTASFTCDVDAFDGSYTIIADGALASTGGNAAQSLAADAASTQYYCFEVTLPSPLVVAPTFSQDDYMGLVIAPAWEFQGAS